MRSEATKDGWHLLRLFLWLAWCSSSFFSPLATAERVGSRPDQDSGLTTGVAGDQSASHHEFILRQAFHHNLSNIHDLPVFIDADPHALIAFINNKNVLEPANTMRLRSRAVEISYPRLAQSVTAADQTLFHSSSRPVSKNDEDWVTVEKPGPDVTDRETIINLAKMTSDAYVLAPSQPEWLNLSLGFNHSYSFGWIGNGLRGHVFSDVKNETVIVTFKGTSIYLRDNTRSNDRLNDNILFSCCCGDQRPDPYPYAPVCGCRTGTYTCNSTCLTQELMQANMYYPTALAVMHNVTSRYPNANVWVSGHSMGGAIASLAGLTLNMPSVTFEAPPQRLPAERLGLTVPPQPGIFHFGHTADPIFMGACNGWSSSCGIAGYAFESQCFIGKKCVYDTMGDKGWHLSITNHPINTVIPDVLEKYDKVATCEPEDEECYDCYLWKFNTTLKNQYQ